MFNPEELTAYTASYTADPLAAYAGAAFDFSHPQAHMICGKAVGLFLQAMVLHRTPLQVLELGTMLGYSALCMGAYLEEKATLHTIEKGPQEVQRARAHMVQAGKAHQITVYGGEAATLLDGVLLRDKQWDLVFIDADKKKYLHYYQLLLPRLTAKGMIIADNAFFHAQVWQKTKTPQAQAIDDFNRFVFEDKRVLSFLLPLRDGLHIIIKK